MFSVLVPIWAGALETTEIGVLETKSRCGYIISAVFPSDPTLGRVLVLEFDISIVLDSFWGVGTASRRWVTEIVGFLVTILLSSAWKPALSFVPYQSN